MNEEQLELIPEDKAESTHKTQDYLDAYRIRLAEYLKDPKFRAIEGFPHGEDEDILALSDPPYYTACPNPFLTEILEQWDQERVETRQLLGLTDESYQREPFASDVSEGKNDPIYNAHSYHTKVPHKAIMRYILHYTDPGDIVFDGFCGTGMTGVAAQLCGDKKTVESLGYRVDETGLIWNGNKAISHLGARKAVLNDLSPAATFIAYNYNTPVDTVAFEKEAKNILKEVEKELGWMYETWHPNCDSPDRVKAKINYTVWSDVFVCPNCSHEMVFWDEAVDKVSGSVKATWDCPGCGTLVGKSAKKSSGAIKAERAWETHYDRELKETVRQAKQVPVLINYTIGKNRFEKNPDKEDLALIAKINQTEMLYIIPSKSMPIGFNTEQPKVSHGLSHVHHFYTRRNMWVLAAIYSKANGNPLVKSALISVLQGLSKLQRFRLGSTFPNMILSGTLYVGSMIREWNAIDWFAGKIRGILRSLPPRKKIVSNQSIISTSSASKASHVKIAFADYIFIDPPFGGNLMYSELSFIWEAWLKVFTNNTKEAIINDVQRKSLVEYQDIMQRCFDEFYKVLKPGKWMTVEFHNSRNSVWNAIQEGLLRAGFVVADVRVLDKKQQTFKQVTSTAAVKQDLIISAYKPNGNLEERFKLKAGSEEGAWDFVRYHLGKLPIINEAEEAIVVNPERQAFLLFDRMVAFHIQRGVFVPLSASEFYAGLDKHFVQRDGMYFLPDQVADYDAKMLEAKAPLQLSIFVNDEKTAINWLRQQLDPTSGGEPKTQGDLTNDFNRVMNRAKHEEPLELIEILSQNFLQDEEGKWYVPDHHRASDLEKMRQRDLLRDFKGYVESSGRLRVFRSEAIRAGFADSFKHKDYATIIKVAERLPEAVLREDPDLLMYYDSALLRKK